MSESIRAVPMPAVRPASGTSSLLAGPTARAEAIAASDMAAAISGFDWGRTPLGPAESWPQSLKSAVRLMLGSRYPMFIWWGPGLVGLYNDAYAEVLGPRHPWALGRPARETWSEIWDVVGPQSEAVLDRGASTWNDRVLLVMERKGYTEETYFTFSYSPCFDDAGEVGGLICTCTDETGRVLGDRRLKSLAALSSAVLDARNPAHACESAASALAGNAHDLPFALVYLAEGPAARLVASSGSATGTALAPRLHPLADGSPWPMQAAAASRQPQHVERVDHIARVDAGPWPEPVRDALVLPLPAPNPSAPAGFLVAGLNPRRPVDAEYVDYLMLVAQQVAGAIADARAREEEQQRATALAELDRAKTTFFSNVSHELRTPLALMLGPIGDLLEAAPPDSASRRPLEVAQRNGRRLQRMVDALLDFSRIEAGRMQALFQPLDLARATAELASFFDSAARRGGLLLEIDCPPLPQPVYVDRGMWEKIVFNLVSNALKYTPAGSVRVRVRDTGGGARLEVTDTGLGIPQAALPHVFDRFYRVEGAQGRSVEGSGIGLALVAELARIHRVTPQVQSWLGAGSTFSLELPYGHAHLPAEQVDHHPAPMQVQPREGWLDDVDAWFAEDDFLQPAAAVAREPGTPLDMAPATAQRADILLVDDNADMRGYLTRLLGRDYDVRTATDGYQALQRIADAAPDLVLTDVMMGRMDGLELLRRLRADPSTSTLPVIVLSANAADEARLEALDRGADDFLVKPFQARDLLARITGLLRLAQVRRDAMRREQQLRGEIEQVLESIGEGFVAVDSQWRMTYVNAAAESIYGRSRESMLGRELWELFPELVGSAFEAPFRRAMAEREPQKADGAFDPLAGWYEASVYPVQSGGLSFYFRDVLQSRLMEQSLREGEEQQRFLSDLGRLLQQLEDPREVLAAAVRAVGEHLRADRCVWALVDEERDRVTLHGEYRRDGVVGRGGRLRIRHFDPQQVRLYREGKPFVVHDVASDPQLEGGRENYLRRGIGAKLSAGIVSGGRIVACIAVQHPQPRRWSERDIALVQAVAQRCWEAFERAQVQQRQRESARRLRDMAESMPQIVYVADGHGRMLYLNGQWERYTGRKGAGEADRRAVVHPDDYDEMNRRWRHAISSGGLLTSEFRVRHAQSGVYRWWLTRAVPVRDEQGRIVRWYGTSTDIDDFKRNAEALGQAHAALQQVERRKDQFIATLAHELRNPLAPLRNGVQLLALGGGPDGGVRVQAMMKRQIDHLVRLVDDLLEVSRITSGKVVLQRSRQDIAEVLHAAVEGSRAVIEAARHSLHVEVDALAGECLDGDPMRLGQVFTNLLNNAAKYTEPGGRIALRGWRDGAHAVVQVQDNGIGLAPEMLEEVFQPFVQADRSAARAQGGLGIGLSIVRSLVELHGGAVRAQSGGEGKGSTFEVRLPLTGGTQGADPAQDGQGTPAPQGGPSVLVVDDNHDAADSLAYMLEMMGATTRVVYGGPDAVEAAQAQVPDLVLLDLGMPGMDGYEVARRLAQHPERSRMLLVALTGWGQSEDRQRTSAAGFDEHLVKPAEIDALEALLARARARHR